MNGAGISGKFFYNVKTLEDLRGQYRKLVMIYHPDKGGKTEDMQALNAEYTRFLAFFESNAPEWREAVNERQETQEEKDEKAVQRERRKKAQDTITWQCTPEQLERMNCGEREAVDIFFEENAGHLRAMALRLLYQYNVLRRGGKGVRGFVELDDLINQAYIDIRTCRVFFEYNGRSISRAIWRSMYYAPVGGAPEDLVYQYKARGQSGRGTHRRTKIA